MSDVKERSQTAVYEAGYHITPTVSELKIPEFAVKMRSLIEKEGGRILSEEMPKLRAMAYEIIADINSKKQKFDKSYFGWIKFEVDNSSVEGIKKILSSFKEIIRFILVKTARENTMFYPKFQRPKREYEEGGLPSPVEIREVSEAEIDKSIEELVIN